MTETEWLACTDPRLLLDHARSRATPRQLRLFACACVREQWALLADPRSRRAVEVAERFAEGRACGEELQDAHLGAFEVARASDLRQAVSVPASAAARAAARTANPDPYSAAHGAAFLAGLSAAPWALGEGAVVHHGERDKKDQARRRQCQLLRDILGSPFRLLLLPPDWLAWNRETVPRLARDIDEGRRYGELPVLGDALEEAGCDLAVVLEHCRGPGPHGPGCWVVDLVLGRH